MSGTIAAVESLFQSPLAEPAAAAATVVLADDASSAALGAGLAAVAPRLTAAARAAWVAALAGPLARAGISAPRRLAAFLGQCSVESGGFLSLEEDLSYSAERLCVVWPNRFPSVAAAASCARQPEALANVVYADRLGNGDPASGDGWRFRGRGLIQITGRENYQRFATSMGIDLDQAVTLAGTQGGAADSACWFWTSRDLNALADSWSIDLMTQKINGGLGAAAERLRLCEAALKVIGG
ncbi:MAG TPA: glycoside hydrolase family 19 protein [Rhodopila sp.]|jgi:putative chitinase|nr:glycoside hydrolase family 19 protein [Rhodopila sp.]